MIRILNAQVQLSSMDGKEGSSDVRIATDFNWREDYLTIVLPDRAPAEVLVPGTRVILYEPGDTIKNPPLANARGGSGKSGTGPD